MTIKIDTHVLYKIIRELKADDMGYVSFNEMLKEASGFYNCSPLAVRNFIYKNLDKFDLKRGEIRVKLIETAVEQAADLKEYEEWLANRTQVLDECLEFLRMQNMTPYVENLLVLGGTARDEFKSYGNSNLVFLLLNLKNEFGFSPKSLLKEGEMLNAQ